MRFYFNSHLFLQMLKYVEETIKNRKTVITHKNFPMGTHNLSVSMNQEYDGSISGPEMNTRSIHWSKFFSERLTYFPNNYVTLKGRQTNCPSFSVHCGQRNERNNDLCVGNKPKSDSDRSGR